MTKKIRKSYHLEWRILAKVICAVRLLAWLRLRVLQMKGHLRASNGYIGSVLGASRLVPCL